MKSKSLSCNIAIIPPPAIAKKAIVMSRQLKKHGGLFTLDGKKYFPHITLYMTEFPKKNLPTIKKLLRSIAQKTQSLKLSLLHIEQKRDGSVVLALKSPTSHALHTRIVYLLNHLREGSMRPKDVARFYQLTRQEQRMLRRCGFKDALTRYAPHLTFTKLSAPHAIRLSSHKIPSLFYGSAIGLFQSGDHGTCRKLLARFYLR